MSSKIYFFYDNCEKNDYPKVTSIGTQITPKDNKVSPKITLLSNDKPTRNNDKMTHVIHNNNQKDIHYQKSQKKTSRSYSSLSDHFLNSQFTCELTNTIFKNSVLNKVIKHYQYQKTKIMKNHSQGGFKIFPSLTKSQVKEKILSHPHKIIPIVDNNLIERTQKSRNLLSQRELLPKRVLYINGDNLGRKINLNHSIEHEPTHYVTNSFRGIYYKGTSLKVRNLVNLRTRNTENIPIRNVKNSKSLPNIGIGVEYIQLKS